MLPLVLFGQGFGEMASAYDSFETVILDRTLVHDDGAVLT